MPKFAITLDIPEAADFLIVLEQARDQAHAWMKANQSTDEERRESEFRLVTVQKVIDQLKRA